MRYLGAILILFFVARAFCCDLDPNSLLKRDLSGRIEFISESEIRYCPDNTCNIYTSRLSSPLLATYVYLHILHESTYSLVYRESFIKRAKEQQEVMKSALHFCKAAYKTSKCVISGMAKYLGIKICFGRYDEGY